MLNRICLPQNLNLEKAYAARAVKYRPSPVDNEATSALFRKTPPNIKRFSQASIVS